MNSKTKKIRQKKLLIIFTVAGVVLTLAVVAGFVFQNKIKTVLEQNHTSIQTRGEPKFVFNTAKFPDWATAGNVWAYPEDSVNGSAEKGDIPISSISVSQCKPGSNCNRLAEKCNPQRDDSEQCKELAQSTMNTHCFVMAFYRDHIIDSENAVKEYVAHIKSFGDMTIQEAGSRTLTMETPEGNKEYNLHYYDYRQGESDQIKHGNAIGYVSINTGHVEVRSICSETSQLDETLPVVSAISLKV